jgi:phosphoribosyl 1,2-cyclic phosphodiesterase
MRIVTIASGSGGNCTLVSENDTHVLIDAGISMRRIKTNLAELGLSPESLAGILVTHDHSDHISGLPMVEKYFSIPVYAPPAVASVLYGSLPGIGERLFRVPVGESFSLGSLSVLAFHTPHDAAESVGYRLEGESVFALATDVGHITEEVEAGLSGADAVVIEANHDPDMLKNGPYPYYLKKRILSPNGHLSNGDCAALCARLAATGTRCMILGHLSRENNTPEAAFSAVDSAASCFGARVCTAPAAQRLTVEVERHRLCSL